MPPNQIWFTSDNHFGHANIIKFCHRPFDDVDEMNAEMIKRWNEKVAPEDLVYHLGDFALMPTQKLRQLIAQLNGKIHLIVGNHEKAALGCTDCFEWVKDTYELKVEDKDAKGSQRLIVLLHYAMRVWNKSHNGSWHLYGHSHGSLPDDISSLSFDVSVDCHDFYPISYQEVKDLMATKKWSSPFEPR
jgi:calcineurin-like phosphoesterase family protein